MSIIGKIVEKAATHIATSDTAINALDKVTTKLEKSAEKSTAKLFKKAPDTEILVFDSLEITDRKKRSKKEVFNIYGENQELRYTVKGKLSSKKCLLSVYDAGGRSIGLLKEKAFAYRGLVSFETSPVDYSIEIYGKKLGEIKSKGGIVNRKYQLGFYGWHIKGNVISGNYTVVKENEEIAKINRKSGTYILTFREKQNELLLLMVVLALFSDSLPDENDDW